jgi:radical SAM family uncharacterized protein
MSLSANEIQNWLKRNLLKVQKPGRYVGGEFNQIVKPWNEVSVHLALAFPDVYEIGTPNLGLTILYDIVNKLEYALAERVFSPWVDMEELMRKIGIPLFSLESKTPLQDFDIIGISLPYETLYTNALNILDLSKIPLHSADRKINDPLIIAGGHAVSNPEPMADFIDAFALGDGEELIQDIISSWLKWKKANKDRTDLLKNLACISGVYIPRFYTPKYFSSGFIETVEKNLPEAASPVVKRIVASLPPPPTRPIVPSIDVVHNRISIEIMRGCSRGCRFCHAGMINRPIRERSLDEILTSIDISLSNTGYEEVALLSLSSSDYSQIQQLVSELFKKYQGKHLSISLPSLRIESLSIDLLETLKESRSGGFTLAPEAASEKVKNTINKPISSSDLINVAREIFQRGWQAIKLYFMIGLPNETLEDVKEIANLCKAVIHEGRKIHGKRTNLHVSIGTFIPKPHTPFQWQPMDTVEQIEAKQILLQEQLRGPGIRINWPDVKETLLESWLSRGDRHLSSVIENAWKNGAKFDAWQDQFNNSIWIEAFRKENIDPSFYSHRERKLDEVLPWDHISMGISKKFLMHENQLSKLGKTQNDCSKSCHDCGILPLFKDLRNANGGIIWKCPEIELKDDLSNV